MEDNMKLPEGKTARQCIHFKKCSKMFGCRSHYTNCDFSPSRFREDKVDILQTKLTIAKEALETLRLQLNYACYDIEILDKMSNVWEAYYKTQEALEKLEEI